MGCAPADVLQHHAGISQAEGQLDKEVLPMSCGSWLPSCLCRSAPLTTAAACAACEHRSGNPFAWQGPPPPAVQGRRPAVMQLAATGCDLTRSPSSRKVASLRATVLSLSSLVKWRP